MSLSSPGYLFGSVYSRVFVLWCVPVIKIEGRRTRLCFSRRLCCYVSAHCFWSRFVVLFWLIAFGWIALR